VNPLLTLPWETLTDRSVVAARMAALAAREIIEGRYAPGALLTEVGVAESFGASRTPAREAMLQLERWHLVRIAPKKGAIVTAVDRSEHRDTIGVRAMFEIDALRTLQGDPAAVASLGADLRELLDLQTRALDAGDVLAFASADYAFHARIIRAGGNTVVMELLDALGPRLARLTFDVVIGHPDAVRAYRDEHARLAELAADGRAAEFAALVRSHIDQAHGGAGSAR